MKRHSLCLNFEWLMDIGSLFEPTVSYLKKKTWASPDILKTPDQTKGIPRSLNCFS